MTTKIAKWIEEQMPSCKTTKKAKPSLDTMQSEAIEKLKESRKFMTEAINSIGAKYNETKV